MAWYDWFANFYDLSVESFYRDARVKALERLAPRPGDCVLVLACGTGQDFDALVPAVGEEGLVIGLDASAGMLKKARARVEKNDWANVRLVEADAREVSLERLAEAAGRPVTVDGALVSLGLSVIPEWESVFQATWELLAPGGRYVIFDVYADRWVPQTWYTELIARADLKREVWAPLERLSEGFEREHLPGSPHLYGGSLYLSSGTKPTLSRAPS